MEIMINNTFGGFGLYFPIEALDRYLAETGKPFDLYDTNNRNDKKMIQIIKECDIDENSGLEIIEIPDGVDWCIREYDGVEWVAEQHRTWHSKNSPSIY